MTATEFWSAYYGMPVTAADLRYPSATVEHVTLTGDWFAPVAADVCHIAERNYGWEDIESGVLAVRGAP
jgi:hypothetical protein